MISQFIRVLLLTSAAAATTGIVAQAQVTTNTWTGAASTNYLDPLNWSAGVAPGATTDILLTTAVTNRVINLSYAGATDQKYEIYAIQNAPTLGYTFNIANTGSGTLTYSIVGRGTHPFGSGATTTSTQPSSGRQPFYLNVSGKTVIDFTGNVNTPNPATSTSGLTYAKVTLTGGAKIDASMIAGTLQETPATKLNNTLQLGGLNFDADSSVNLGKWGATVSALCLAGQEEIWAGVLTQETYTNASNEVVASSTQKWGQGITRLTGTVYHPGMFVLRVEGQYLVDGTHNGPITTTMGKGCVLGGKGTINGAVSILNGTSLAPGGKNATGSLTINGNVSLDGALSFELFSPTDFDRLTINGLLDLTPATGAATGNLSVGVTDSFPLQPGRFRVATFTSVDGTFASVSLPSSQGLIASYVLGPTYVDVIFTQVAYGTNPQLTGNYKVIASGLDAAILLEKVPGSVLNYMNRLPSIDLFRQALDQFSPTCFYGWYPAAVERYDALTQSVTDRLDQRTERAKGKWDAWGMSYRQESSIGRSDYADYTNFDTMSVTGGVDTMIAPGLVVGGLMEYAATDTDLNQQFSTSTTDSYTLGAYAQSRKGQFEAQVMAFAGKDKYKSERNVSQTTLGTMATSKTNGTHYGVSFSTSYTKKLEWVEVTPYIGGQLMRWNADEFAEEGAGAASLVVKSQKETSVGAHFGLRVAQSFSTKHGYIRPFLNVTRQMQTGQETRLMNAELFGEGITLTVPALQKHGTRYEAGVDWDMSKRVSMQVRYLIQKGGVVDESLAVRGGVNVFF